MFSDLGSGSGVAKGCPDVPGFSVQTLDDEIEAVRHTFLLGPMLVKVLEQMRPNCAPAGMPCCVYGREATSWHRGDYLRYGEALLAAYAVAASGGALTPVVKFVNARPESGATAPPPPESQSPPGPQLPVSLTPQGPGAPLPGDQLAPVAPQPKAIALPAWAPWAAGGLALLALLR